MRSGWLVVAVLAGSALAQEQGYWRASNQNAKAITGDVGLSRDKLTINFVAFSIAEIRALEATEKSAVFGAEDSGAGVANLYRLRVPATTKFLRKNTLCGSEETEWMVTLAAGKTLRVAFFSGGKMPVLSGDVANSAELCGVYSYVR